MIRFALITIAILVQAYFAVAEPEHRYSALFFIIIGLSELHRRYVGTGSQR